MTYNDIDPIWQQAIELEWEAFKSGSLPIAALLVDGNGMVVAEGRNNINENLVPNPRIAHAEATLLRNLDIKKHPDIRSYTLYTTMEPCPMCMGTMVMSNIRKAKIMARDYLCGAAFYCEVDPYIAGKHMQIEFEGADLEWWHLVIQNYVECKRTNLADMHVVEKLCSKTEGLFDFTIKLYQEQYFDKCVEHNTPLEEIVDYVLKNRPTS